MDSLQEMQILCNLSVYFLQKYWMSKKHSGHHHEEEKPETNEIIINILLIEHIFSYITGIFRTWEINNYGKTDVNGIKRAPKETLL